MHVIVCNTKKNLTRVVFSLVLGSWNFLCTCPTSPIAMHTTHAKNYVQYFVVGCLTAFYCSSCGVLSLLVIPSVLKLNGISGCFRCYSCITSFSGQPSCMSIFHTKPLNVVWPVNTNILLVIWSILLVSICRELLVLASWSLVHWLAWYTGKSIT